MSIVNLPIITTNDVEEIRQIFISTYTSKPLKFQGFDLKIFPEDFEHICYEPAYGGIYKAKFSIRRARKLLAILEATKGNIPYLLIHQVNRENKSICVLCESIEYAFYIIPVSTDSGNYFIMGTAFAYGKDIEKKIEKQKSQGIFIEDLEDVFKINRS